MIPSHTEGATPSASQSHEHSHTLHRTTLLRADLESVFDFFRNPRNLELLTPPWLGFRIRTTTDDPVREGTRITYRLRLHGIPLSWESRITEYADNAYFADEQLHGPYARWYHRHHFRTVPDGVEMIDDVEYRLPFGVLGRLVNWFVVRHQLNAIFDYRAQAITKQFGR